jgi:type IV pilus assembly protein PilO
MKVLQTQVSDLEKLLPKEKQIPQLLRAITKSAQQYQLKITQITPQPIVAKANYSELPFQLSVQGNFHTLALFLTDLGQGSRLMSARNVVFSQPQQAKDASVSLSATFTLVAYTFKG